MTILEWVPLGVAVMVGLYCAQWALRLLAAHVKATRMRKRGVVGVHVEAGFWTIRVVVPERHCEFCAAQLAQANPHDLCQTCQLAGVRT